jgi:hypothetical protein
MESEYPWENAPDWANYAARDSNGEQWWYEQNLYYCLEGGREADDPLAVSGVYGTGGARAF